MRNIKIVIVDDERDITESLKLGLERRGFSIITFNDPTLALKELNSIEHDLIILDIRMPKMNGFELYREIRKRGDHTPICFFSAFEIFQREFATMFPEIDATVFLKKPARIVELELRINQLISKVSALASDKLVAESMQLESSSKKM